MKWVRRVETSYSGAYNAPSLAAVALMFVTSVAAAGPTLYFIWQAAQAGYRYVVGHTTPLELLITSGVVGWVGLAAAVLMVRRHMRIAAVRDALQKGK